MGDKTERRSSWLSITGAVRLLAAIIFLGYLVVWMITPTNRYRTKWQAKLRADTSSAFLGSQGTNILVFTFPILFIAILGCLYAHLKNRSSRENTRKRASFWNRPAIMSRPLGIVTWTELLFLILFIALLLYFYFMYLKSSFSRITAQTAAKKGEKIWESKMDQAAHRMGILGALCLAFLFFPVTRGSSILPLAGLTSEGSIKYHIWLGNISMLILTVHGLLYVIYWASTDSLSSMRDWAKAKVSNVAGEVALIVGLVMWAATLPRVRRKMFEIFYYTHQLYAVFLLFFLLHVGMNFFFMVLPGIYLFMVDRFLRFLQSRERVRLVSARILPGDTVELNFAKSPDLKYSPRSTVFVNVPAVSKLQWHPFSVTSSSNLEPDTLSVAITKQGSWTTKLHRILSAGTADRLEVAVEGPYSPISTSFSRFDSLVLISGGSGITPIISIIRDFISGGASPTLHLICAFKSSADLTMLNLLLPLSRSTSDLSRLNVRVDAYVTRDNTARVNEEPIRTLWFKANNNDKPVAAVLGTHGWLVLAAIIASSFGFFLILLGIMNRHYHSNSLSAKALLSLLMICGVIAGTATAAFFWSKRQYQISDAPSPGDLSKKAEQEIESVPRESLALWTNVHYGSRPDLKKILSEHKEESVGVLVSGPRGMRSHVAKICSSEPSSNLHYESMSFSW